MGATDQGLAGTARNLAQGENRFNRDDCCGCGFHMADPRVPLGMDIDWGAGDHRWVDRNTE